MRHATRRLADVLKAKQAVGKEAQHQGAAGRGLRLACCRCRGECGVAATAAHQQKYEKRRRNQNEKWAMYSEKKN